MNDLDARLLTYLRNMLDDSGVDFVSTPEPLLGGFETKLYRFALKRAPDEMTSPLILRLYPHDRSVNRPVWESAVMDCLREAGLPIPKVFYTGTDLDVFDHPFLIMEFMPGKTMFAADPMRTPALLGVTQASLHNVDVGAIVQMLRCRGIDDRWFHYGHKLDRLIERNSHRKWLAATFEWLDAHRPSSPDSPAICHGDFHPLNLLVEGGSVSAILDWSNFSIADPVMDVAFTELILRVATDVFPGIEEDVLIDQYLAAYSSVRLLDNENCDYYRTLRCAMALVEGADGHEFWVQPRTVRRLTGWIEETTGITVNVPVV